MKVFYHLLTTTLLVFAFGVQNSIAQDVNKKQNLQAIANEYEIKWQQEYTETVQRANEYGIPLRRELSDGSIVELQKFKNGMPLYLKTYNLSGANLNKTADLWPGGSLGLNLTGSTQTLGIWDGGKVRDTHQDFGGRVTQEDGATTISDHATHVAGTMIGSGVDSDAQGMAYEGTLKAYEWTNDASEMATAAGNGMLVSNHSYGILTGWEWSAGESAWYWYGDTDLSETVDANFGYYDEAASEYDEIVVNAPNYVIVKAAGNDRNDFPVVQPVNHFVWDKVQGDWVSSTVVRDPDGDYKSLGLVATAKNIITVGAVSSTKQMANFSSWGPTNDGRIKPDIVAKGVSVYSAVSTGDSDYNTKSGTSMASPVVSGSVSLLQEHYFNLYGEAPLASTIKALVIHTAEDLGNAGPDYAYGWGMLDTKRAAEVLSSDADDNMLTHVIEANKGSSSDYEYVVWSNGEEPLTATIAWTDPAATPITAVENMTDRMLINDLDLRIIDENDNEVQPYILNPANPSGLATLGDNNLDNVEQVHIENPERGYYTIRVSHKGSIDGVSQQFSMIVTGNGNVLENTEPGYLTLASDDEDGFAYVPNSLVNDISGNSITVELWVKMDADSDEDAIILSKKESGDESYGYRIRTVGDGEVRPIMFAPVMYSSRHVISNTGIRAGEWTHIAAVYDDGDTYLYINGELDAQSTNSSANLGQASNGLTIGSNTGHNGQFFRGSIDELRIWGQPRSMFDIRGDFMTELTGDETGLLSYYPFSIESNLVATNYAYTSDQMSFNNIVGTESPGVFPVTPVVHGKIGNESVQLKITERSYAEGIADQFKIYRTDLETGSRTEVSTVYAGSEIYTVSGETNRKTYKYEVTVLDDEGNESDFSNPLMLTPNSQIGGTSIGFDNQGFLNFTDRPNLNISGDHLTIEFWIRRYDDTGTQAIITNEDDIGGVGYGIYLLDGGEEARIQFTPSDYSSRHVISNAGIRAYEWTHIAAVYNNGNTQLYINGKLDVESINNPRVVGNTANDITIGANAAKNGLFYNGELDELRIWDKSRTLSEIQGDFNKILWGDEENLTGYWRFNEVDGDTVYGQTLRPASSIGTGSIFNYNFGSLPVQPKIYAKPEDGNIRLYVETPEYAALETQEYEIIYNDDGGSLGSSLTVLTNGEDSYLHESVDPGLIYTYGTKRNTEGGESGYSYQVILAANEDQPAGQALRFETNQSAHVQFEYNPSLDITGDSLTVEAWINKGSASQAGSVILGNNPEGSSGYSLYLEDAGQSSRVTFAPTNYNSRHVSSETYLEPNTWYHVAGVYRDGETFIYINGALDASSSSDSRSIGSSEHGLVIGASHLGADKYFIGEIDEVRIWEKSRTNTQIAENYNKVLIGNENGLLGYWRFDEGSGDLIHGAALKPLNGTLINSPQFVPSAALAGSPFVPILALPEHEAIDQQVPLTFSWHPVDNAVHYELEISENNLFNSVILEREIPDTAATVDLGLEFDSTYYWRVRAITNQFATNWSDAWQFTTELPVPEIPEWEPENGSNNVQTDVTLVWSESERAESYRVQMSMLSDFSATHIDTTGIPEPQLAVNGLDGGTTYYWRVSAINRSGESGWSEILEFTTVTTSAEEIAEGIPDDFKLDQNYPNPFNPGTIIQYAIPASSEVRLAVYDMLGRQIAELVNERQSAGYHQVEFNASHLASGVYIYRLKAGETVITKKMMLTK